MLETYKNLTTVEWELQFKTKDSAIQLDSFGGETSNRIETEINHNGSELCDGGPCGKVFSEHSCLKSHRRSQIGGNTNDGNQYGQNFLTLRKKTSTGEKLSMFNQLGKGISPTPDVVYQKTMQEKNFECGDSGKAFVNHSYVQAQMKTQNGENLYEWKECGRSFIHSTSLGVHVQSNTGNSHHECKECGKSFKQSSYLNAHVQIHTAIKPFKLKECGKAFIQCSELTEPIKTDIGEKPFICDTSGKAFDSSSNLSNHSRSHTREKRFQCIVCGNRFTTSSYLVIHT
nr:zinc finger protein 426-like isoform X2 [Equus asinus]